MTYVWLDGRDGATEADVRRDFIDLQHRRWVETQTAFFEHRFWLSPQTARMIAFRQINAGRDILDLPPLEGPP